MTSRCNKIEDFGRTKDISKNVIAAVIQATNDDLNEAKVIVLASGTKCISSKYVCTESITDGTRVHDSHAEVVARRSLMVYFYYQLKLLCEQSTQGKS